MTDTRATARPADAAPPDDCELLVRDARLLVVDAETEIRGPV
ncbi:hypothetical protein SNOUR_05205 [Streptomyces noursei ATCC 11455]|nr:hypothetical protein SNOUR_05205 [Streptomyces noursei ATCC 11455]